MPQSKQPAPGPLVSVVIPCYNLAQYLGQAIESLLGQSYTNLEIAVVDDGSTDNIGEVMAPYLSDERIRLISQSRQGAASARNNGIGQTRGPYLQFLDQDDWLHPAKTARQVAILQQEPAADLVYCDYFLFFQEDGHLAEMPGQLFCGDGITDFDRLWLGSSFPPHAPLVRREMVEKAGGFYPGTFCSDYDFWLRLAALGCSMRYLPETLVYYRRHTRSMTGTISQENLKAEVARVKARVGAGFPQKVKEAENKAPYILQNTLALRQEALHEVETRLAGTKEKIAALEGTYRTQYQSYRQHAQQVASRAEALRSELEKSRQTAKDFEAEIARLRA